MMSTRHHFKRLKENNSASRLPHISFPGGSSHSQPPRHVNVRGSDANEAVRLHFEPLRESWGGSIWLMCWVEGTEARTFGLTVTLTPSHASAVPSSMDSARKFSARAKLENPSMTEARVATSVTSARALGLSVFASLWQINYKTIRSIGSTRAQLGFTIKSAV